MNSNRRVENEVLALWLAPIVSTLPLIPFFSFRFSPLFLGTLMADPTHPTAWPWVGPVISAMGVMFDGTLLGYGILITALPIYLILRKLGRLSTLPIVLLGALAGIAASQFVAHVQHFKQPGLSEFASSWFSPALGCLSGGTAGLFVAYLSNYRRALRETGLFIAFLLPIGSEMVCAFVIALSAQAWRAH
jgi:hypothetical protein